MAALKTDQIVEADLAEYLTQESDFSFESSTVSQLIVDGFQCEHGGTYKDSITQKYREFDIRAKRIGNDAMLRLAVECKNVRKHFPVLICGRPRRDEEAFHEVVLSTDPDVFSLSPRSRSKGIAQFSAKSITRQRSLAVRLEGQQSIYQPGAIVGKSCDQVGRSKNGGEFQTQGAGIYDKWAQALSSADELVARAFQDGTRFGRITFAVVVPVVVVPDETLWLAEFDENGTSCGLPRQVDRCPYYVGRRYTENHAFSWDSVTISHIEFVTRSGLTAMAREWQVSSEGWKNLFQVDIVFNMVNSKLGLESAEDGPADDDENDDHDDDDDI